MITALWIYAIIASAPVAWAADSYHRFTREEIADELERRIAEPEEPLHDNDNERAELP